MDGPADWEFMRQVLTWCFPDEESQKAQEVAERIAAGDRVIVPAFWRHEKLNALLVGEKRRRLTPELTRAFKEGLDRLRVDLDTPSSAVVFNTLQALCRKHSLTAYDAAYLEIAIREKNTLATVDQELRRAVSRRGSRAALNDGNRRCFQPGDRYLHMGPGFAELTGSHEYTALGYALAGFVTRFTGFLLSYGPPVTGS